MDDGSTDNTSEIILSIQDDRVRYIKMEQNQGVSAARNLGVEYAEGKIIAFQDSDDAWKSDKLEKQNRRILCAERKSGRLGEAIVL